MSNTEHVGDIAQRVIRKIRVTPKEVGDDSDDPTSVFYHESTQYQEALRLHDKLIGRM